MSRSRFVAGALVATTILLALAAPACRDAVSRSRDSPPPPTGAVGVEQGADAAMQSAGPGATAGASVLPQVDAGPEEDAGALAQALGATARALTDEAEPRALVRGGANEEIALPSRFEVELPRLADFRVRLLDEADRAVASTDRAQVFSQRLRYQLVPNEPLTPGSRYALVVDGLRADLATDDHGRAFERVRIELKTSGERPPTGKRIKPSKPAKPSKPGRRGKDEKAEAPAEPL